MFQPTVVSLTLGVGNSTCSDALHVFLQHRISAGWVAAGDILESLVSLDVVGEALEEGLVADRVGIVGFVGFGVGGFVCAVGQVHARVEVHCHYCLLVLMLERGDVEVKSQQGRFDKINIRAMVTAR